jgi:HPt (histidine-containing phosphotransfer) domain-containing protein
MMEFLVEQSQQPTGSPDGPSDLLDSFEPAGILEELELLAQNSIAGLVARAGGTLEELADALDREANQTFHKEAHRPLGQNLSSLSLINDKETFKKALNHLLDGEGLVRMNWEDLDQLIRQEFAEQMRAEAAGAFDAMHERFVKGHPDQIQEAELMASMREPLLDQAEFGSTIVIIP